MGMGLSFQVSRQEESPLWFFTLGLLGLELKVPPGIFPGGPGKRFPGGSRERGGEPSQSARVLTSVYKGVSEIRVVS